MIRGNLLASFDTWSAGAIFSNDRVYRYVLWRNWDRGLPRLLITMVNPSKADAIKDDATVRRWRGYARSWGFGGFDITNMFGYRATDPADLHRFSGDRVGPDTDMHIAMRAGSLTHDSRVVVAWGGNADDYPARVREVVEILGRATAGATLWSLGTTESGQPLHPLRQAKSRTLVPWDMSRLRP